MANVIGFCTLASLIIGLIIDSVTRGREAARDRGKIVQKLEDLITNVDKQNGRIGKIEESETRCAKSVEHRLSTVEANQKMVISKVIKDGDIQ